MSNQPRYEVELKYKITAEEYAKLPARLAHGFAHRGDVVEIDTFLPVEKPGDIIRIRDEQCGDHTEHVFTQKTWVQVGNRKERQEQEENLSKPLRDCILDVLHRMSPKPLPVLMKRRSFYEKHLDHGQKVTVTLDTLPNLGEHSGHYMEIEIMVSRDEDTHNAHAKIDEVARQLLLDQRQPCQMSYKQMLDDAQMSKNCP